MLCNKCQREIPDDAIFCSWCGATVESAPVNEQYGPTPEPAPTYGSSNDDLAEEQEFLDLTHRYLRWERKAWSIAGKVLTITGIIFAAIMFLCGVILLALGDSETEAIGGIYVFYSIYFALLMIPIGVVCSKSANKIPQYLDSMYMDFEKTEKRCGSAGMLVLAILFNNIAMIFFILNFVRMKSGRRVIERIKARQRNNNGQ